MFRLQNSGFTLVETLVAIVVLIIGFSLLISAQNSFIFSTASTFEEVDLNSIAKNLTVLILERGHEVKNFEGYLADFFKLYNFSDRTLSLDLFRSFRVALTVDVVSQQIGEDILDFKKVSMAIFGPNLSKTFQILLPP